MFFLFKTNPKIPIKKSIIDKFIIILYCLKMCGYCYFFFIDFFSSFEKGRKRKKRSKQWAENTRGKASYVKFAR